MKVNIPNFNEARIMVVGDIMMDRYWYGNTARISPEAPVPIVKVDHDEYRPGGAANVALNIANLGGQVSLFGITGDDDIADKLDSRLSTSDVICQFLRKKDITTITKLRVLSRNQQLLRLDFEESLTDIDKSEMYETIERNVSQHHLILLSDYDKGTLSDVQSIIQLARKNSIPVVVDPKGANFNKYRGASILTPNMSEFEDVVGHCIDETELVVKGKRLLIELELDALLITRSQHGMTLIRANEEELHIPTQAQEVYDVTGAGDTVIATLALSIAAGSSFSQASGLANTAAGIVVGKLGTSTVSEVEIAQALASGKEIGSGVVSEEQLEIIIEQAKKSGQKVVLTNGCFDILHAGHVSYLTEAAKQGDKLIVAVNDDQSVKRLKGRGRPVNPLDRRMAVLAGLSAVDWVVDFSEDTPQRLIANLLPDLLVKGGDYNVEDIAGGAEVIAAGGEVQVLNFEEGISTTELINTIRLED